ncbi:hypothetical protein L6452_38269 [Arctium lappa]|uniref:Uncharacterized protein n=1 Tax=Arctium lappa TaxID=4217 RepID=A0ACB8Y5V6_ARCLA|nr:hypothetical protein L6452_38269 [Arctium lappa]
MDFFKSMLSDDPEPENMDVHRKSDTDRRPNQSPKHQEVGGAEEEFTNLNLTSSVEVTGGGSGSGVDGGGGGGLWSFGDLVKTITTRSESVLETYRRDLKEFGSGLRKESDLFREVASRAVKELPSSIEVGASAIDGVLKSTADIISQGKEALLEPSDFDDSDASESVQNHSSLNSRGYSRFDSQLNAIQTDARTYCVDPDDIDDYSNWKLGFLIDEKESEIEKLIGDNGSMDSIYRKLVPNEVDDGSFWCRYFYRVHKLKQQEDMRANLVRRSLTADDEEELSWDVDEDEDEEKQEPNQVKSNVSNITDSSQIEKKQNPIHESETISSNVAAAAAADDDLEKKTDSVGVNKNNTEDSGPSGDHKVESMPRSDEKDLDRSENGVGEDLEKNPGVASADKNINVDDLKHIGDVSDENVESVPKANENRGSSLQEDEDIEWDEIEDLGEHNEKKISQDDTPKKGDLFKQLNGVEDDEDLSWDIEDDDEPVKAGKQ